MILIYMVKLLELVCVWQMLWLLKWTYEYKDEEKKSKNLLEKYDIPTTYKIKDVEDFMSIFS